MTRQQRYATLLIALFLILTSSAILAAPPLPAPKTPMDLAFGAEVFSSSLISHALDAPATFATLGSIVTPDQLSVGGCEFDTSGDFSTLYCVEATDDPSFFAIDTSNGAVTPIGTVETLTEVVCALATDPTTGVLYGVATSIGFGTLYTIDFTTAATTPVGGLPPNLIAAGFSNDGQLYAIDISTDTLVRIDKLNASVETVGPLGFDAAFNHGMDFDASDNTCYIFAYNDDTDAGELRTCDPATGSTTLIGPLGDPGPGMSVRLPGAAIATQGPVVFADGFEAGDTRFWSAVVP